MSLSLVVSDRPVAPAMLFQTLGFELGQELVQGDAHANLARQPERHLPERHSDVDLRARCPGPAEIKGDLSHSALEGDTIAPAVSQAGDGELGRPGFETRHPAACAVG